MKLATGIKGFLLATLTLSTQTYAGDLHRLSADFMNFNGSETSTGVTAVSTCTGGTCTPGTPDGSLFYRKDVTIPEHDNVLFVGITAQADTHGGAALWMSCRDNGRFCNTGTGLGDAGPAGWVSLLKLPVPVNGSRNCNDGGGGAGDCHDNGIAYQWCVPINECVWDHRIDLKLASSTPGEYVFFERANIYIDSAHIRNPENRCVAYRLPPEIRAAFIEEGVMLQ